MKHYTLLLRIIVSVFLFNAINNAFGQIPYLLSWSSENDLNFDDSSVTKYFYIDTLLINNIWQIGKPQKIFMDSAYSVPNAMITDTTNPYPVSNISTLLMIFVIEQPNMNFSFRHKYDTDSLMDGGKIEFSFDGGNTWANILDISFYAALNINISVYNFYSKNDTVKSLGNDPGFTGNLNGWIVSSFDLNTQFANFNVDTFHLRFVFSSDTLNTNKEGWVIDDIYISAYHVDGIDELQFDNKIIYPNPAQNSIKIITETNEPFEYIMFDVFGKIVTKSAAKVSKVVPIDISILPEGIYFVQIQSKEQNFTKKFVKIR